MSSHDLPPAFASLQAVPCQPLGGSDTPLERMPNLSQDCGTSTLWIKRDDCTTLAMGGNKARQLAYYFGDALAAQADTVLITGAVQSNFVRLTSAAAAKLNLQCHIQLEPRVDTDDELYHSSGNVLLDQLFGAVIHHYHGHGDEFDADAQLHELAERLAREEGRRTYIVPLAPNHPPLGALGYVAAARELLMQCAERALTFDEIVVASGSGNTHGGLLFGLRALGCEIAVRGVCVRRSAALQGPRIVQRCTDIAKLLGVDNPVRETDVLVVDDHLAPGYGQLNHASREAMLAAARREGLLLDPTYTSKTMATFIDRARHASHQNLLFWHTGGTPALFAYQRMLGHLGHPHSSIFPLP